MKRWLVITPEYGEVVPILDYGQGPLEYHSDVIEIEAETRRDALVLGVNLMRRNSCEYHWFRHCDGNPFVGVKAEVVPEMCQACEGTGCTGAHPDEPCSACNGTGVKDGAVPVAVER